MNLRIITKNHAADSHPTAWELRGSYPSGEKQKIEGDARESSNENFWKIGG